MTASPPKVSVILPAYNAAASLPATLRSVLNQSLREIEVIVVDDGSVDGTAEIATALAGQDGRIKLLRAGRNRGAAAARNRAMEEARGDWLALLDADDRCAPDRLARLVALGEARGADVVTDNLRLVSADGRLLGVALRRDDALFSEGLTATAFVRRNHFFSGGFKLGYLKPLFRRSFVARHGLRQDKRLRIAEDFHFLLDCLMAGASVAADPTPGYDYRQMPGSLSRRLSQQDLLRLAAINRTLLAQAEARGDAGLSRALRRRQWSADLNVNLLRFVEAVKGGRVLAASSIFARRPDLTPFLAFYGLQSLRKRLPGGHRLV
ncbi:MAG: glycosyltransferase family 2 protein [Kiloniellaceae bacterium]